MFCYLVLAFVPGFWLCLLGFLSARTLLFAKVRNNFPGRIFRFLVAAVHRNSFQNIGLYCGIFLGHTEIIRERGNKKFSKIHLLSSKVCLIYAGFTSTLERMTIMIHRLKYLK